MDQLVLHSISPADLYFRFDKLEKQIETLLKLIGHKSSTEREQNYLSRKEVCQVLKISLPTLNTWTKEGKLPSYRIGNRVLYKGEEVNKALIVREFKFLKK